MPTYGANEIRTFLIDETGHRIGKNNVLTWQELLENGRNIPDSILQEKEKEQAVNQACMLIYTSGTTGLPKGIFSKYKMYLYFN